MLAAKRLPEILNQSRLGNNGDSSSSSGGEMQGLCLMTLEGSLLGSSFADGATVDEISLAAIASSIWANYSEGASDVNLSITKLDGGYLGISTAGKGYLLAAYGGEELAPGLLRSRLTSLSQYFTKVFEQIK